MLRCARRRLSPSLVAGLAAAHELPAAPSRHADGLGGGRGVGHGDGGRALLIAADHAPPAQPVAIKPGRGRRLRGRQGEGRRACGLRVTVHLGAAALGIAAAHNLFAPADTVASQHLFAAALGIATAHNLFAPADAVAPHHLGATALAVAAPDDHSTSADAVTSDDSRAAVQASAVHWGIGRACASLHAGGVSACGTVEAGCGRSVWLIRTTETDIAAIGRPGIGLVGPRFTGVADPHPLAGGELADIAGQTRRRAEAGLKLAALAKVALALGRSTQRSGIFSFAAEGTFARAMCGLIGARRASLAFCGRSRSRRIRAADT